MDLFGRQPALTGVVGSCGRKVLLVRTRRDGSTVARVIGEAVTRADGTMDVYLTEVPSDGRITIAREGE